MDIIKFYSVNNEYGEFSNFALYKIRIKGKTWLTSEHYFQAMKFTNKKDQDEIRKAKSPMIAARKGRDRKRKLRKDWESIKENIMYEAIYAKFTQHEELKKLLLLTKDAKLIEHTLNDSYWGDGGGKGKNRLGYLLMKLRDELRSKKL